MTKTKRVRCEGSGRKVKPDQLGQQEKPCPICLQWTQRKRDGTLRAHYVTPPPLFQECAGCTLLRLRVWELERLLGLGAQSASSTTYEEEAPPLQGDLLSSIEEEKKEET